MASVLQAVEMDDSDLDPETGIPKAELRAMLDVGLAQLSRGEGIRMDDAAWERLRAKMRQLRSGR